MRSRLLCCIAAALLLAACSKPYLKPQTDPFDATFPGIREQLHASGAKEADVILIHGMCSHELLGESESCRDKPDGERCKASWVHTTNRALARGSSLTRVEIAPPKPVGPDGALLFDATLTDGEYTLRSHAIVWSPIVAKPKAALCYDVNQKTDVCSDTSRFTQRTRAKLNGQLKSQLMNDCLSDAIIYLSKEGGEAIRRATRAAVIQVLTGTATEDGDITDDQLRAALSSGRPLAMISESLGSKILYDSVLDMAGTGRGKMLMADALARTMHIYMGANQLPILGFANRPNASERLAARPIVDTGKPLWELAALAELRRDGQSQRRKSGSVVRPFMAEGAPLRGTAFTDPNDLLSYTLHSSGSIPGDVVVTDVVVSNDHTWFGLLENPLNAHLGYRTNCRVLNAIGKGSRGLVERCD